MSSKAADKIVDVMGKLFKVPGATRWNSYYDAVVCIVESDKTKVIQVMNALKLTPLDDLDFEFLLEYKQVRADKLFNIE
jgi:hypothetical protein